MTEDNKKILTVSFVLAGLLTGFTLHLLLQVASQTFGVIARLMANEVFSNGVPVAVGLVLFFVLQFNKKVLDFSDSVVSELKKVVWPSRRDTGLMTVVVVITLIISGIVVGLFDTFSASLISWFVK